MMQMKKWKLTLKKSFKKFPANIFIEGKGAGGEVNVGSTMIKVMRQRGKI